MKNRSLVVGIFVVAGLLLFTTGLVLIGNRHEAFARHIEYFAEFTNLSGLTKGAKVQVAGMDAGEIVGIGVPTSPAERFRVYIRINEALRGLVRTDSVATIGTEGVVGDTFLLIHAGSSLQPSAAPQSTLLSKEPTEIAELLDQGKGVLADVDSTVKVANGLLTSVGGSLNSTLDGVQTTVGNVDDLVVGVQQGRGPAGMLVRDETVATQLRQAVMNAQQATADLGHAAVQANSMISDLQSRQLPLKADNALDSLKSAAANVDAGTGQLRQTISEATAPHREGVTAGANLRESVENVNAATANMADETEALKHNFFFRSFFHHRGYFNLNSMAADNYRRDRLFMDPGNVRVWLPGDQIFVSDGHGGERLTELAKRSLGNAIADHGDTLEGSPIVIEGYWNGVDPVEQCARSRSRAILVRNYLQNHFQLDASHFGVVAMKSSPPAGIGRSVWDGVCVVFVSQSPK